MTLLLSDFRIALRMLGKNPVFALTAVVTIGLGLAAAITIFSVVDAVLIQPLPHRDPDRLVIVRGDMVKRAVKDFPFSDADFMDLRNGTKSSLEQLAVVRTVRQPVPLPDGTSEQVRVGIVSPNFFTLLGGGIVAGRDFEAKDGEPLPPPPPPLPGQVEATPAPAQPPPPPPAIVSHEYWQRRLGGEAGAIGRPLFPQGPVIVGVLASGFELNFPPSAAIERKVDFWVPARLNYDNAARNQVAWRVIGRLRPGQTIDAAQASTDQVIRDIRRQYAIKETAGFAAFVRPMHLHLVDAVRPAVIALMGAVIFLLLIACANVANLLLVRASLRDREYAIRTALGGGWWDLVRQALAEVTLLAALGTSLGLGIAWVALRQLLRFAPADLPRLDTVRIDGNVLVFSILMGLAAAAVFGIVPILRLARPDMAQVLRADGRGPSFGGRNVMRTALVITEIALCFVLLTGSGLMLRSFLALQRVDPGFRPEGVLAVEVGGLRGRTPQERDALQNQIRQALSALPGVTAVSATFPVPLGGNYSPIRWGTEQALSDPSKFQAADLQVVLPGYFETMGSRLIEGRTFTAQDSSLDRKLAIIDQPLARKAFGAESAIGKRILVRVRSPEPEWVEVVGVVAHQANTSLAEPGREQIYVPDAFVGFGQASIWTLRTRVSGDGSADNLQLPPQIREALRKIDSRALILRAVTMNTLVRQAQSATRFQLLLISLFAGVAALLAAVGLYGVLSTVVRQRSAEIGLRMALGASSTKVFLLIVGQGLRWGAAGVLIGALASMGLTRMMTTMLVGVEPTDPSTLVFTAMAFLAIAFAAAWIPARRAAKFEPMGAMRDI